MALSAADAYRRAAERFLGKLSGTQTVGGMERAVKEQRRHGLRRPILDLELTFNEAAGVLAISTGQLETLLQQHPPKDHLFEVKGTRKRATTLSRLMDWADWLRGEGYWKPLTERGTSPDTLLTAKLPFLLVKSSGAQRVIVEPLSGKDISDALLQQIQELGRANNCKVIFRTFADAFAMPWLRPDIKRAWADTFFRMAKAQAAYLRDLAQRLETTRAQVSRQVLDEHLQPAPRKTPHQGARRL